MKLEFFAREIQKSQLQNTLESRSLQIIGKTLANQDYFPLSPHLLTILSQSEIAVPRKFTHLYQLTHF